MDGSGITNEWLIENFAPDVTSSLSNKVVAVILGKVLFCWAAFKPSLVGTIPDDILLWRHDVMAPFEQLLDARVRANGGAGGAVDDGANPIQKAEMIASEVAGQINYDKLYGPELDEATAAAGNDPFGGNNAMGMRKSHQ